MRFEIINRQRFKHAVLVAQILLALPAIGETKPFLLVVGHVTAHGWKPVAHPAFVTRIVDPDVEPRVAEAYAKFASISGVSRDPFYVIASPFMEPLAASSPDAAFLDRMAARWATSREAMIEEAGLAVRQYLLSAAETPKIATPDLNVLAVGLRHDHIGGGFFRATQCSIPRFDKSLADQAEYARLYTEAFRTTRDPRFADVARSTLDFVLSDLQLTSGLFAAAQRADSLVARKGPEFLEGGQAVWKAKQIRDVLGPRLGDIVVFHFGATDEGNVAKECDPAGDFAGQNVLLPRAEAETRARFNLSEQEMADALAKGRAVLRDVRSKRPRPVWNPEIAFATNARMISALARASTVFEEPRYATSAARSLRALGARKPAFSDFIPLIDAFVDTYEVTFDLGLLERAFALRQEQSALTPSPGVPAPVAALLPPTDHRAPAVDAKRVVFIAGDRTLPEGVAFLRAARGSEVLLVSGNTERVRARIGSLMPYLAGITPQEEKPVATLCEQRTCRTPTGDPAVLEAWLK